MYETLQAKVGAISLKYADLVDKRVSGALREDLIDGTIMNEINDGIRMLNHVTATLERIDRLNRGNETSGKCN